MDVVFKAAAAYLIVLVAIRLFGRRTLSQQSPLDMALLFLFSNMTIAAVLGDDRSLTGALSAIITVGLTHVGVCWLKMRFVWFERVVDGTPLVVFRDGAWDETLMRHLRMQQADVRTATRQRGFEDLDAVAVAIVERDGRISVIPKASRDSLTSRLVATDASERPEETLL